MPCHSDRVGRVDTSDCHLGLTIFYIVLLILEIFFFLHFSLVVQHCVSVISTYSKDNE